MVEFIGVDYGSKKAGTTALAFLDGEGIALRQCSKKDDADLWLEAEIKSLDPEWVFIDAPLGLPAVYTGAGNDYFYRKADRECKAMSPMFLGGLTARAMKLRDSLKDRHFFECYPGYLARNILEWRDVYNKKVKLGANALGRLEERLPHSLNAEPSNWHQFDAVLCWLSAYRHKEGQSIALGDPAEGLIIV